MVWRGELTLPKTALICLLSSPLCTDRAKPLNEPRLLRTEQELRQRGARRRDRDFGANCLERRSGNKQRGGESGDRKSRRA
eukprot:2418533-Pleurochrysis_carterae.AAC.2